MRNLFARFRALDRARVTYRLYKGQLGSCVVLRCSRDPGEFGWLIGNSGLEPGTNAPFCFSFVSLLIRFQTMCGDELARSAPGAHLLLGDTAEF